MAKKKKNNGPRPAVLFVCVRNGGKSQLAAALMRDLVEGTIDVHSAGTQPGTTLNKDVVAALAELNISTAGCSPTAIDPDLLNRMDLVVVLGNEAQLDPGNVPMERWVTTEPSEQGVEGIERMRLIRDDVHSRVIDLYATFG